MKETLGFVIGASVSVLVVGMWQHFPQAYSGIWLTAGVAFVVAFGALSIVYSDEKF